jgi:hypothetical protein
MYFEEIKHSSHYSDKNTHANRIRNAYFENRSCLANVLDFLDQEVVIIPRKYFSYAEGISHIIEDDFFEFNWVEDDDICELVDDLVVEIYLEKNYHLSVLDSYITIVSQNMRCIFTNRDMEEGNVIGTIFWVRNFNELLKKFSDKKLKRISKAIVCPLINKNIYCLNGLECLKCLSKIITCLDGKFFSSMDIYYPEIIFKYNIDSYMSNVCIDVYNKLVKIGLNGLVEKYIPSYKQCD